jgi:hypothetical protein
MRDEVGKMDFICISLGTAVGTIHHMPTNALIDRGIERRTVRITTSAERIMGLIEMTSQQGFS